jgi:hypothetical protein
VDQMTALEFSASDARYGEYFEAWLDEWLTVS